MRQIPVQSPSGTRFALVSDEDGDLVAYRWHMAGGKRKGADGRLAGQYAARGIVFLVLGAFLLLSALKSQRAVGSTDALRSLLPAPFGAVLLALVAIGLVCFAVWRLAQALLDADHLGADVKALAHRGVYAVTALFYIGFASVALTVALGWDAGGSSDQAARDWTAWLLGKPFGQWLTGIVGFAIVATGLAIGGSGVAAQFKRQLELKRRQRVLVALLGTFGSLARAVVFVMIGVFLIYAAIDANSREARGFAGTGRLGLGAVNA